MEVVALALTIGLAVLLVRSVRRHRESLPRELLHEVPEDVRLAEAVDTPAARAFWDQLQRVFADFERCGHHYQYRQFVDLLACGPREAGRRAAAHLAESRHLGLYASDMELRNELAEIAAHTARDAADRAERDAYVGLLARLRTLSDDNAEALSVWFRPACEADLMGPDLRRQAHAVYMLARLGNAEQLAQAQAVVEVSEPGSVLRAEWAAGRSESAAAASWHGMPPLPPAGDPLPSYADLYERAWQEAHARREAERAARRPGTGTADSAEDK